MSEEGKHELMSMHKLVCLEVEQLVDALKDMDEAKAATLLQGDDQFKLQVAKAEAAHLKRVFLLPGAEVTHDIHMELINLLEQVHHYCKSIAGTILSSGRYEG